MRESQRDNMKKERLLDQDMDNRIREALSLQADVMESRKKLASDQEETLRSRVLSQIEQIEEETTMKHSGWKFKRIAAVAGAMCILGSAAVMAAGHFYGLESHSTAMEDFTSYEAIKEAEKTYQIPFEINAPEQFDNGYTFDKGHPVHTSGMDEQGNKTPLPTEVSLSYVKAGLPEITLDEYVSRPEEGDAEGTHYEKDGVSYYYSEMDCLFVPPSYELSEEEKAAEQAGTLSVGYGSDEVERTKYACVKWKADGVSYLLMGFEPALTESQMVEMAQEVMEE